MAEILYDAFFQFHTDVFLPEKAINYAERKVVNDSDELSKLLSEEGDGYYVGAHKRFLKLKEIIIIADPAYIKLGQSYTLEDCCFPNNPLYVENFWLESERCHCPQCQKDGVERRVDSTHFMEYPLRGNVMPKYIIPMFLDMSLMTITETMKHMLEEQPFKGYKIFPIQEDEIQIKPDFQPALRGKKLQLSQLRVHGRVFPLQPCVCKKCGWDQGRCEGGGWARTCPNCHNGKNIDYPKLPASEETFPMRESGAHQDLYYRDPIPAHRWNEDDFIECVGGFAVSGRVARWLTENQIGPVCLCPYPTDVSHCTEQQRQAIEQIRFKHPHAVAPKISK